MFSSNLNLKFFIIAEFQTLIWLIKACLSNYQFQLNKIYLFTEINFVFLSENYLQNSD